MRRLDVTNFIHIQLSPEKISVGFVSNGDEDARRGKDPFFVGMQMEQTHAGDATLWFSKNLLNTGVQEILGEPESGVTGVRLIHLHTNKERILPTSGVFIAIGHKPNTNLFRGQLDMDEVGYIKTSH